MSYQARLKICMPLQNAISSIQRWIRLHGSTRLIVATSTIQKFKMQPLPDHIKVTRKQRKGKRVSLYGLRNYHNKSLHVARWPDDFQEEISVHSLICIIKGMADFHIGDYSFSCMAGDVLLIPSGIPQPSGGKSHIKGGNPNSSNSLLWMCPKMGNAAGMEVWLCHSKGEEHVIGKVDEVCWIKNAFIIQLFQGFCEELLSQDDMDIVLNLFNALLSLVKRDIQCGRIFQPGHFLDDFSNIDDKDPITKACAYINAHLHKQLTIDNVARVVFVSSSTLTRQFRTQTGKSFLEYVTEHRMIEAAMLLKTTDWSVNKICEFVGLKYSQLRRLFLKHYDCSPGKFRAVKDDLKRTLNH